MIRVRLDLYTPSGGQQCYVSLKRTATVVSCNDARQAEGAAVSIMRMCTQLDGLELDNPDLVMERL